MADGEYVISGVWVDGGGGGDACLRACECVCVWYRRTVNYVCLSAYVCLLQLFLTSAIQYAEPTRKDQNTPKKVQTNAYLTTKVKELIGARKTSHKHNNKDLSLLQ